MSQLQLAANSETQPMHLPSIDVFLKYFVECSTHL